MKRYAVVPWMATARVVPAVRKRHTGSGSGWAAFRISNPHPVAIA